MPKTNQSRPTTDDYIRRILDAKTPREVNEIIDESLDDGISIASHFAILDETADYRRKLIMGQGREVTK